MQQLLTAIEDVSPYAHAYHYMAQVEQEGNIQAKEQGRPAKSATMFFKRGKDQWRYMYSGAQPQVYKPVRVTRMTRKVTCECRTWACMRLASSECTTRECYTHKDSQVLAIIL